jgi:Rrf2 family protein
MLTRTERYKLSVVIFLVDQQSRSNQYFSKPEIHSRTSIPEGYLGDIITELSECRIVETKRGKNGGARLNLNPEKFTLGKLFKRLDLLNTQGACQSIPNNFSTCPVSRWTKQIRQIIPMDQPLSEFVEELKNTGSSASQKPSFPKSLPRDNR